MTGNPITANIGQGELHKETQDGLIQHVAIFLADGGILSDETFRLVKFSGQESISQPFHFQLELRARTEPKVPLNFSFKDILARQEPAWEQDTVARYDTYKANSSEQIGDLPFRRFQICQYGGSDGEVKWDAATCDATRTTAATSLSGASHCARMRAGHTF